MVELINYEHSTGYAEMEARYCMLTLPVPPGWAEMPVQLLIVHCITNSPLRHLELL